MTDESGPRAGRDERKWLLAIVLFAAVARLWDIDWDQGHAFHPDERAMVFAVQRLSFSPLQLNPEFFAYGSLPLYAIRAVASVAGLVRPALRDDFMSILLIGRALSALAGVLTVYLLFRIGSRLFGRTVGLLGAGLLAACPLHIQLSHFMTTEAALTLAVLFALGRCLALLRQGRTRDYVYAGAAIGLALAIKVSAAPLLAPLIVAALWRTPGERPGPILGRVSLALVSAALTFFAAEPYALLDSPTFWRQVREQGDMVRHAGVLPYTIQYVGTLSYLYDLGQMILWGMAPALGLAAVWAALLQIRRFVRVRDGETAVLMAWTLPYFLITGAFEVKFIRYLLPVYPVLILWAAAWAWSQAEAGRRGRWAMGAVAVGTFLAACAFLSTYRGPHTVVAASEWVYRNVPAGATIVTQHWDEGFPLPLEKGRPDQYRVIPFPFYEPDNEVKVTALGRDLAGAQYVAFPTKRLYGAITRVPDRYPLTDNAFRLLFEGHLGYRLIYEAASRPSLLGLEVPDELADESFTVYDHPKVLIFANEGRLPAEELERRIRGDGVPSRRLSRKDLLLARPGRAAPIVAASSPPIRSSLGALLVFAAVVELLGLAAYAGLRRWLPRLGGYATAKVLGLLLYGYVSWLLAHLVPGSFARGPVTVLFLALMAASALAWRRRPGRLPHDLRATELLCWGSFVVFAALRAWNPPIFWGEKPMDFAFLNALARTDRLPPPEPWFAGSPLHYTYFGHYLVALLGKLGHLLPGVTFNLGVALAGALTATAGYAAGVAVGGSRRVGFLAAALVTFAGNLSGPLELVRRKSADFDYFWATSRVIKDTINEYPFWSFVFADLHAHVLVMPLSLTFLALAVRWVRRRHRMRLMPLALLGVTLGAVTVTSVWSTPVYTLILPFLLLVFSAAELGPGAGAFLFGLVSRIALPSAVVLGLSYLLYLPFWRSYVGPGRNWGWERDTYVVFTDYAQIFGLFLFVAVPFLLAGWRRLLGSRDRGGVPRRGLAFVTLVGLCFVLSVPVVGYAVEGALRAVGLVVPPRWAASHLGSVRAGLAGLGLLALYLALRPALRRRDRTAAALLAFAFFVCAGCDVVHVWDRMNTIFKFYLDAWLLFAASGAAALSALWRSLPPGLARRAWVTGVCVLAAASLLTSLTGAYAMVKEPRAPSPRPTLDGTAYLAHRDADESQALEWLNANIPGTPVIAEAWGQAYGESARVSMNTGAPTVIGWEYHVHQRSHPWREIQARKADVERLYGSPEKAAVAAALARYGVALVYVGGLERDTYGGGSLERFAAWNDLLTPVYRNDGVAIFGVKGRVGAVPPVEVARAPAAEPEAPPADPPGRLRQPRGVAVDAKGNVYVADFGNHRIQKFGPKLELIQAWGGKGRGPLRFDQPCQVAVGGDRLYVADTWNQRIQVLDLDGRYLTEWKGDFFGPRGIAVGPRGRVYLADTGNHRIRSFDEAGKNEFGWGKRGSGPGEFIEPIGIATDADGRVYVCDNGNARLQVFGERGEFQNTFPVPGWRTEVFSEPKVAVTPDGTVWVTVPLEGKVRAYTREGRLMREITGSSLPASTFAKPLGIAYNGITREMVVSDLENRLARIPLQGGGRP